MINHLPHLWVALAFIIIKDLWNAVSYLLKTLTKSDSTSISRSISESLYIQHFYKWKVEATPVKSMHGATTLYVTKLLQNKYQF